MILLDLGIVLPHVLVLVLALLRLLRYTGTGDAMVPDSHSVGTVLFLEFVAVWTWACTLLDLFWDWA